MLLSRLGVIAGLLMVGCEAEDQLGATAPPPALAPAPDATEESSAAVDTTTSALTDAENDALDSRTSYRSPRATALLVTELSGLTTLLNATPETAPDRPLLVRRIAEDYVELARAAERDAARSNPSADPRRAATLARAQRQVATTARRAAIASYTALLALPYAQSDEARYYLALERARVGDMEGARRSATDLIASGSRSAWASRARLLLGVDQARAAADPTKHVVATKVDDRPICSSDLDCEGVTVCRAGRCIDPFASTIK